MSSTATTEPLSETKTSPNLLLQECQHAETLSLSNEHVNFLLKHEKPREEAQSEKTNDETKEKDNKHPKEEAKAENEVYSILKMNFVSPHKVFLEDTLTLQKNNSEKDDAKEKKKEEQKSDDNADKTEEKAQKTVEDVTQTILNFLTTFDYKLTSESGAEYSFYTANTSSTDPPANKKDKTSTMNLSPSYLLELISPASQRQITRHRPSPQRILLSETPDMYQAVTKPYIDTILQSSSLNWIENIITGKKEQERCLFQNEQWLLNIDTKWKSHPDPHTVPKVEWYQHASVSELYCLGFVKTPVGQIASLRDLRPVHIPLLQSMFDQGLETIQQTYGVAKNQIRVYCHYQPQFYHFHVHFTRVENQIGAVVERGHLIEDVIQNLKMSAGYYEERTLVYGLGSGEELFKLFQEYDRKQKGGEEV